jgi:hypothetical protein
MSVFNALIVFFESLHFQNRIKIGGFVLYHYIFTMFVVDKKGQYFFYSRHAYC